MNPDWITVQLINIKIQKNSLLPNLSASVKIWIFCLGHWSQYFHNSPLCKSESLSLTVWAGHGWVGLYGAGPHSLHAMTGSKLIGGCENDHSQFFHEFKK